MPQRLPSRQHNGAYSSVGPCLPRVVLGRGAHMLPSRSTVVAATTVPAADATAVAAGATSSAIVATLAAADSPLVYCIELI